MSSGIYLLKFIGTDKVYIGKSLHLEQRLSSHIYNMRKGTSSKKLQQAFIDFGEPELHIIHTCSVDDNINLLEISYIHEFDSVVNGFNTSKGGEDGNTSPGELNGRALGNNTQYIKALELLVTTGLSTPEIAKICGLTPSSVQHISSIDGHSWLAIAAPDLYNKLVDNKAKFISRNKAISDTKRAFNTLVSPEGIKYDMTKFLLKDFCKAHNLTRSHVSSVLNGRSIQHKGWHTGKYTFAPKRAPVTVLSPQGELFTVEYGKYTEFAKVHGMDPGAFRKLVAGTALSHHGWKKINKI